MKLENREALIKDINNFLIVNGYKKDRFGNYNRIRNGYEYRYKFSKISLRHEIKSGDQWVRIQSGYLKDIIIENDMIKGLTY